MAGVARRVGVVLGAGGIVGHGFHAGVLAALEEAAGLDPRDAEVLVGTSAGSIIAALLRAGISAPDLAADARGERVPAAAARVLDRRRGAAAAHGLTGAAAVPGGTGRPAFPAARLLAGAVLRPWSVRPGAVVAGLLPDGSRSTAGIAAGFEDLFDGWPSAGLEITAVRLDDGRRVVFGRDDVSAGVPEAVSASCAIPGYFTPVRIGSARYVDGGVHSPTNADVLAGRRLDLVIASSPMSATAQALRRSRDPLRSLAAAALAREVALLRARGTRVVTFAPTTPVLAAMGRPAQALDLRRRPGVTRAAHAAALEAIARGGLEH